MRAIGAETYKRAAKTYKSYLAAGGRAQSVEPNAPTREVLSAPQNVQPKLFYLNAAPAKPYLPRHHMGLAETKLTNHALSFGTCDVRGT